MLNLEPFFDVARYSSFSLYIILIESPESLVHSYIVVFWAKTLSCDMSIMATVYKIKIIVLFITFSIPSPPSASSTAADRGASSRGAAPWLKAACSPERPFPRHTAARCGQLHSLPASAQVPAAAGRPVLGRVTSLGDHRPPRAGQGSLSGAGRKTGVSWRQATTRQGAGAMVWEGRREKREKGGGRGK